MNRAIPSLGEIEASWSHCVDGGWSSVTAAAENYPELAQLIATQPDDFIAFFVFAPLAILAVYTLWYWVFHNPFRCPCLVQRFDVSNKRKPLLEDYIDEWLLDDANRQAVREAEHRVEEWKDAASSRADRSPIRPHRRRQLAAAEKKGPFVFQCYREQTRYRQVCYQRFPYTVEVPDQETSWSWEEVSQRVQKLADIGFETTLSKHHAADQRKLMSPALRRQIMERDDYTCQSCGKRMPDEVGLQIDHIVPVSKGGKSVPTNLQVLCSKCNGRKGNRSAKPKAKETSSWIDC